MICFNTTNLTFLSGLAQAKLVSWAKGFNASGVEGKDVVQLLQQGIDRSALNSHVKVVALVNDTVGVLVSRLFTDNKCMYSFN